ncbi:hypothetical protein ACLBO4_06355, partial [Klebsiella pneumoniae]
HVGHHLLQLRQIDDAVALMVSRLRHKARQQGIHLPVRAIFGKGLAFIS